MNFIQLILDRLTTCPPIIDGTYYEWTVFLGAELPAHNDSEPETIYTNDRVLLKKLEAK